ncbi:hypothetical protein [Kineosporia babensis]|uniref:Uncharacterized protein n=1 Tax=Kineosporia babensis TaxID=499548 RepID=A0A9X1NBC7_9ACTN|nr:hypothetical protein [Kineosporia babensis]MCD5310666.1 hypothetical protein [Kineosporia babensis]
MKQSHALITATGLLGALSLTGVPAAQAGTAGASIDLSIPERVVASGVTGCSAVPVAVNVQGTDADSIVEWQALIDTSPENSTEQGRLSWSADNADENTVQTAELSFCKTGTFTSTASARVVHSDGTVEETLTSAPAQYTILPAPRPKLTITAPAKVVVGKPFEVTVCPTFDGDTRNGVDVRLDITGSVDEGSSERQKTSDAILCLYAKTVFTEKQRISLRAWTSPTQKYRAAATVRASVSIVEPSCVTRGEYKKLKKGWSRKKVEKTLGVKGTLHEPPFRNKGKTYTTRDYRTCEATGWDIVQISYVNGKVSEKRAGPI